jgi:hypothetical protein
MFSESTGKPFFTSVSYQWVNPLVLLIAVSAIVAYEAHYLMRYPVAVGLDGYYYVLQLKHLRDQGSLYFPTITPLLFYLLSALDLLVNNPVLTIKLAAITLHALLCLGLFFNIFAITRNVWLGVLSSVLATASPLHFFLVGEFLKNLLAITLLIWCGFCIQQAVKTHKRRWTAFSVVLLILAFLSHKSAVGIVCLLALEFLLLRYILLPKFGEKFRISALLVLLLMWVSPLILKLQPMINLSPSVLAQVRGGRRWGIISVGETLALMIVALATLYLLASLRERLPNRVVVFFSMIAVWALLISVNPLLNPIRDWDSLFGRLKGLSYIQVAILVPGLIWITHVSHRRLTRYAIIALPLLVVGIHGGPPPAMSDAILSRRAQIVRNLPVYREHLCADPIIIATHGDQFLVTDVLGVGSQKDWPEDTQHQCTYWLLNMVREDIVPPSAFVLAEENLTSYGGLIHETGNDRLYSVIIKDEDFFSAFDQLAMEKRSWLQSFNPHLSLYLRTHAQRI